MGGGGGGGGEGFSFSYVSLAFYFLGNVYKSSLYRSCLTGVIKIVFQPFSPPVD